jgi:Leucine-rich repeat (LRR) protein
MKFKIFAILGLITSGFSFYSGQKLHFKDKNLEKAVLENFDLNKNGSLESLEADKVTNLFLVQKNITSADDLVFFKNVKMVVMDDNTIPAISISGMDHLELFSCTGCRISSFKATNLKKLSTLYLDNNLLENISLKEIPAIEQLTLSLNQLKTIDVTSFRNLKKLNIEQNRIQKLDISENTALQTLNIGGNKMKESDIQKGSGAHPTIFGNED